MKWTDTQKSVIETRNKNILVSAAAGSGKTAVLVERIIQRILDEKDPVDVDKILVVTYTNAAAAEMKERVRKALDKAVLEDPKNSRLRTQATLVHTAQIRTIDSFCSYIVKNYFYEIDADPAFRIGDTGAVQLLKEQALDEALAACFENPTEDFKLLADAYMQNKKTVATFKKLVYDINEKASSYAWPEDWFKECFRLYEYSSKNIKESPFIKYIVERCSSIFADMATDMEELLGFYPQGETSKDGTVLRNEMNLYKAVSQENDFEKLYEIIGGMDFAQLRLKDKGSGAPEEFRDEIRNRREACKGQAKAIQSNYFSERLSDIAFELEFVGRQVKALLELTEDFRERLFELKKKKGIFEFNDIEHMALHILRNAHSKEHEKRAVASELSAFFKEVMVDEYQDSNDLQEAILTAVCTENNYFTVGDVKQSIYAFRQASPALFNEKFHAYPDREDAVRIDLDSNFRSREEVLEFSNRIFFKLMQQDMGKVSYDDAAALKPGALGYEKNGFLLEPEILVADSNREELDKYGFENA
ncbi:MAG: UvrD-helicase domain-containing protein, partial [Parasporobacterium sp.]|nr:UvrD-helicase domain-containing protein [Parasporobacterium sp.]